MKIDALRDLQYAQPLDYPSLQIQINRDRAGQFGVTAGRCRPVARRGDLVEPLHRSEFLARSGQRQRLSDSGRDPAGEDGVDRGRRRPAGDGAERGRRHRPAAGLGCRDASTTARLPGEVDRYNMQRVVSFTANIHGKPLGAGRRRTSARRSRAPGAPPRGVTRQQPRAGAGVRRNASPACAPGCCSRFSSSFCCWPRTSSRSGSPSPSSRRCRP